MPTLTPSLTAEQSAAFYAPAEYTGTDSSDPRYWRRSAAEWSDPTGVLIRTSRTSAEIAQCARMAAESLFVAGWLEAHRAGFPSGAEIAAGVRALSAEG